MAASIDADLVQQFTALGVTLPVNSNSSEPIDIMRTNWDSFDAWMACQTQWRMLATFGGLIWLGLDYAACRLVLDDIKAPARVFSDLRVMEDAALTILNSDDGANSEIRRG